MFQGLTRTKCNETLLEIIRGILLYGIIGQLAVVCFCRNKANISIGWWIGVLCAVLSICHMWLGLDRALSLDEKGAIKLITAYNMVRYAVIVLVMGIVVVTRFGNPLAAMFGIYGMKAGAYMQPVIHRFNKSVSQPDHRGVDNLYKDTDIYS